jgi:hypothetical protein
VKIGGLLCSVLGHRYHVDDDPDTPTEVVLVCSRCGRKTLAPNTTGFDVRVGVRTGYDRSWLKR